jgi:hypothetical protein
MKRTIAAIIGLALLTALSASAQTMTTNQFKVAFAFMAGDKTLPAGEYHVQVNLGTKLVTLFGPAGPVASMMSMDGADGNKVDGLQFQQFGDTWVLQQVKVQGYAQKLFPSKFEKELAKLNPPGRQTLIASSMPAR